MLFMLSPYGGLRGAREVFPGLYLGGADHAAKEVLAGRLEEPPRFRFFSGAMVWGPGELEQQAEEGSWATVACCADLVLTPSHELGLPLPLYQTLTECISAATSRL